jgi:arabinofuranosyltransferase
MAPLFALCAPVAVVPVARRHLIALVVLPWALVCATTLRTNDNSPWASPSIIYVDGHGSLAQPSATTTGVTKAAVIHSGSTVYVQLEAPTSLQRLSLPFDPSSGQPTLATFWIGPEAYQLGPDVKIEDLFGLADPLASHMQLAKRDGMAGHEKPLPIPWMAALLTPQGTSLHQLANLEQSMPGYFPALIPSASGRALQLETAWARAALRCPAIKGLLASTTAPLTPSTVLSNAEHALSHTTLRIPPDPAVAYREFCGSGTPSDVAALQTRPTGRLLAVTMPLRPAR